MVVAMARPRIAPEPLILAVVLLAHYAPGVLAAWFGDPDVAIRWIQYSTRGIEAGVLAWLVLRNLQPGPWQAIGVFSCCLAMIEEGQIAICGAFGPWQPVGYSSRLCTTWLGPDWYQMAAAATLATAITYRRTWRRWSWMTK
jgi:hypothetical protein